MKPPRLKRDWEGLKVITLTDLENGFMRIPYGTECVVRRNYAGLSLKSDPCARCGVSILINSVPESAVRIKK